jgi:hypothetical protein
MRRSAPNPVPLARMTQSCHKRFPTWRKKLAETEKNPAGKNFLKDFSKTGNHLPADCVLAGTA